jgi:hypothetical protein
MEKVRWLRSDNVAHEGTWEVDELGFFNIDNLPDLSIRRVTREQILKMFELHDNKELEPIFD